MRPYQFQILIWLRVVKEFFYIGFVRIPDFRYPHCSFGYSSVNSPVSIEQTTVPG
jgi:hypothetical protein